VQAHGAGDGADGAEPTPYFRTAWIAASRSLGWVRQPQVVVGGEVDDLFAVELRTPRRWPIRARAGAGSAFRPPLFKLVVKIGKRVAHS